MSEQLSLSSFVPCGVLFPSEELEEGRASHPFPSLIWRKQSAANFTVLGFFSCPSLASFSTRAHLTYAKLTSKVAST